MIKVSPEIKKRILRTVLVYGIEIDLDELEKKLGAKVNNEYGDERNNPYVMGVEVKSIDRKSKEYIAFVEYLNQFGARE